jgi:pimeloyl-ACP methyl ester carboxylesterase
MSHRSSRLVAVLVVLLAGVATLRAQAVPTGRWEGAITVFGQQLGIIVVFSGDAAALSAAIDIPQQKVKGMTLGNVRVEGTKVHFELPAPQGPGMFDGERKGDEISGSFEQAGVKGTFDLKVAAPETPPPYGAEEVTIQSGSVRLACTLTLPPSGAPHPAVVLLTGSGAQDRDEDILGFKIFKVIADHLTRAGVAVLRCDDRGVGGSTGSVAESTSADFADDAIADVHFLASRADIDRSRIGLLGHSEGGLIAPLAASKSPDIRFIVLMSGPALNGERIMIAQGELLARAENHPEAQIRANQDLQRKIFAAVRSGQGWDEVADAELPLVRAALARVPEDQRKALGDLDALARKQVDANIKRDRSPWFKFFLDYDPAPALAKVTVPVLAIFGERDLQVPTEANRQVMEDVFRRSGHKDHRIVVLPRANHLYQEAKTGSASEYSTLKREFVPGFLDLVTTWILQHTKK